MQLAFWKGVDEVYRLKNTSGTLVQLLGKAWRRGFTEHCTQCAVCWHHFAGL